MFQIKKIDIAKRSCETVMGTGEAGNAKGDNLLQREVNEPGGLCCDSKSRKLYIADTNNHDIKVLHLDTESVHSVSSLPFLIHIIFISTWNLLLIS